jgi:hypothetical protein
MLAKFTGSESPQSEASRGGLLSRDFGSRVGGSWLWKRERPAVPETSALRPPNALANWREAERLNVRRRQR